MNTPISQYNQSTNINIFHLLRRFFRRPLHEQVLLAISLLRGQLVAHRFDKCDWPRIEKGVQIAKGYGRIEVGRFTRFEGNSQIAVFGTPTRLARFQIGDYVSIGPSSGINVAENITIGHRSLISWNCDIMDTDFHSIQFTEDEGTRSVSSPVVIGDDVWIGAHCIVLKGVTIGTNSVIGAGSVVTQNIPPNCLAAGNPARVIRSIVGWRR